MQASHSDWGSTSYSSLHVYKYSGNKAPLLHSMLETQPVISYQPFLVSSSYRGDTPFTADMVYEILLTFILLSYICECFVCTCYLHTTLMQCQ